MFVEREERKKSVYKRERLSRYVCVLRACVICYLFFFFLFTRIYTEYYINILKTPLFLISSQRLFCLLRRQLQKRQRVQLDASTVVGQLGAEFTHRNSRVSFQIVQLFLQFQVR